MSTRRTPASGSRKPKRGNNQDHEARNVVSPSEILPREGQGGGKDHVGMDTQLTIVDVAALCLRIQERYAQRRFAVRTQIRLNNALRSHVARALGYHPNLTAQEGKAIFARTKALIDALVNAMRDNAMGANGMAAIAAALDTVPPGDKAIALRVAPLVLMTETARAPADMERGESERVLVDLAEQLPAYATFVAPLRGFAALGLAIIVGEAGNLSNYDNPAKLWKRLGVGIVDGKRQGRIPASSPKEMHVKHGFNKQRRSAMWTVFDSLLKGQSAGKDKGDGEAARPAGPYRTVYDERKAYEIAQATARGQEVRPAARIPNGATQGVDGQFMTEGHIHKRAFTYAEKRLLRDLWKAWRRETSEPLSPNPHVSPVAEESVETIAVVSTIYDLSRRGGRLRPPADGPREDAAHAP